MNILLSPKTKKLLDRQMKQGGYATADDALRAGLLYLEQQEHAGGFHPGELEKLLAVADAEIDRGDVLDGEESLRQRRQRRSIRTKKAG
jgi:Arc/MetJ-type ribon-helix-helix transcriptional regulator